VDAIWESPPAKGGGLPSLRTHAWQLRRLLGTGEPARKVLITHGDGYRLAVPPGSLDVDRAESLIREATRARAASCPERAHALLTDAVALWDGVPLTGVPGPFAERQRQRLDELRLTAVEERFDVLLDLGEHHMAVPGLVDLAAAHPLRERPQGLLMRALHAAGRRADALSVFADCRRRFVQELGVGPTAELSALQRRILQDDAPAGRPRAGSARRAVEEAPEHARSADAGTGSPGTAPGHETAPGAPRLGTSRQGNPAGPRHVPAAGATPPVPAGILAPAQLPPSLPDFEGRTESLRRLASLLTTPAAHAPSVVVVTGMGGVGKTALALRACHQVRAAFPDGQLHADLRGAGQDPVSPDTLLTVFLIALGAAVGSVPERVEDRSAMLRSLLSDRRVLMVLDNVRDAAQVEPLFPGSPGCAVVITSRACPAGLPLSGRIALDVFSPDEALGLLAAVIGRSRCDAEPAAARRLVTLCGFLPLAVRIVATRLAARPGWTIDHLVARIADEQRRLRELRVGDLAVEAAFEVGHQQLPPEQARAFRLLAAVGASGIGTACAAAALAVEEPAADDLLESLVNAALLESPTAGRYRFHDLVRDFAAQRAERHPDEGDAALGRLLDHLILQAHRASLSVSPGDPVAQLLAPPGTAHAPFPDLHAARTWIDEEFDTIVSAALRAASLPEGRGAEPVRKAGALLLSVSQISYDARYTRVAAAARTVSDVAELLGDHQTLARTRLICSTDALRTARPADAREHAGRAVEASRRSGEAVILRKALNDMGIAAQYLHRFDEALTYYDEAATLARQLGHRAGEAALTLNAAIARIRSGRAAEAVPACEAALAVLMETSDQQDITSALFVLGLAHHELGQHQEALSRYTECLDACRSAGVQHRVGQVLLRLAETTRALGRFQEAEQYAAEAVARCEELAIRRDLGQALVERGRARAALGRTEAARGDLERACALFTELELPDAAHVSALLDTLTKSTG